MPEGADIEKFAGKPIELFTIEGGIADPATIAYNIYEGEEGEPSWDELWDAFINDPRVSEVSTLVIGGEYENVMDGTDCLYEIESLIAARNRLPALKHLFLGANDPMYDDQRLLFGIPDISPLLLAYPQLETLRLYGWTQNFRIGRFESEVLRSLSIATLWLPHEVFTDLWPAYLPALEHLELWLDRITDNLSDLLDILAPLFSGVLFPQLRHLALCNSSYTDDLAIALVASPLMTQLKVLDLSLGNLTDRGAQALLESPALLHLEKLVAIECQTGRHADQGESDPLSDEMIQQLRSLPIETEISNRGGHAFESLDWFQI